MAQVPVIIKSIDQINPAEDKHWVPDGEGVWFLPTMLDLKNNMYSGYWYATKEFDENPHIHRGLAQGQLLYGELVMWAENKEYWFKENQGFMLRPDTAHHAKFIPGNKGFLVYITVTGDAEYKSEILNAQTYYDEVKKYYQKQGLVFNW